jgi:hypothetical protein
MVRLPKDWVPLVYRSEREKVGLAKSDLAHNNPSCDSISLSRYVPYHRLYPLSCPVWWSLKLISRYSQGSVIMLWRSCWRWMFDIMTYGRTGTFDLPYLSITEQCATSMPKISLYSISRQIHGFSILKMRRPQLLIILILEMRILIWHNSTWYMWECEIYVYIFAYYIDLHVCIPFSVSFL